MYKVIVQLQMRYWVSEYGDSSDYFDYTAQAVLIANSESTAIAEVERLSSLRPSVLRYDNRLYSQLDELSGDVERVKIWYEELEADL